MDLALFVTLVVISAAIPVESGPRDIIEVCTDFAKFTDGMGLTCKFHERKGDCKNGKAYNEFLKRLNNKKGETPLDACCACGGGQIEAVECKDDDNYIPSTCRQRGWPTCSEMAQRGFCDFEWSIFKHGCKPSTDGKVEDTCRRSCNNCNADESRYDYSFAIKSLDYSF